ncbi:MAG: lysine--tRNA ligase [Candidatus Parcubacteria bacterium]|nr:lysine--tRNA ligase [Candidatus Parcubacteria bacterium]
MSSFLEEVRDERIKKLNVLKEKGTKPYPVSTKRDYSLAQVLEKFDALTEEGRPVTLVGRVMALRGQGALLFFNINDGTALFQGLLKKDEMDEAVFSLFQDIVDLGDFVQVTGSLFTTKRGEKTLQVSEWNMLSKSLRPLPDKWHGLQDVEERFRKRYLDILMSEEVKNRFIARSKFVAELRKALDGADFLEVETPILQSIAGGATAKPFETHHHALDMCLFLRIAPELYLKELLVAGMPKVYEIGRLFRNEGIDVTHNPEFTTVEFYEAYAEASKHMVFLETLLRSLVEKTVGGTKFIFGEHEIDFGKKFEIVSFFDLIEKYSGLKDPAKLSFDELAIEAKKLGVEVGKGEGIEKIFDAIYKKYVRNELIQPTFIKDYLLAFSPLAKKQEEHPEMIERYQLIVGGLEVVNGFSELNDPLDQRERFTEQEKSRGEGDEEAQPKDEEYIEAMEYGMPPAGGVGLSIDRMIMLITNTKNIREVILFPTLRPKQ